MVKFPEHDEDCEVVLGKLKRYAELAPAVIRARWKDNTEVKADPRAKPAFAKSTSILVSNIPSSNWQLLGSSVPPREVRRKSNFKNFDGIFPSKEEPCDQAPVG